MLALPNASGTLFQPSQDLLRQGCRAAAESHRRRLILPLHRSQSDPVQRMINFLQPGTYVRPHVHPLPGQCELLHVLQGRIGFFHFHEDGRTLATCDLPAGPLGLIDIEPGVWHGLVCLEPDTIISEAKLGPYDPLHDKSFAPWAPEELSPTAPAYLATLLAPFAP